MSFRDATDLDTLAIHGGLFPDPSTGAILTPVFQSTTYVQEAVGKDKGYTYTRAANPTVAALERNLAELEGGAAAGIPQAVCFATGMGAITGLFLTLLRTGSHVVVSDVVYGGTVRLLRQVLANFGVEATFADTSTGESLAAAMRDDTALVFIETPANPTLKLSDLAACAEVAHRHGALLAVDNTFLTPAHQRPFELGADVVVHSTTKYLEGHNSTVGGALLSNSQELQDRFRFMVKTMGAPQAPWEAWLTLRGIKTLGLRMKRHAENALAVAQFLENHPKVARVLYPGLPSFPQYELAQRQQASGGGILAFEVVGGTEAGMKLMSDVKLCSLAENLGAVETLITHPASMTHASLEPHEREALGITEGLVRLSVGLENPQDVMADLGRALG